MVKMSDRNKKIRNMLRGGCTYQEIADHFGLTKGRIAQIVRENKMRVNAALIRNEKLSRELTKRDFQAMDIVQTALMDAKEIQSILKDAFNGGEVALAKLNSLGVTDKLKAFRESNNDLISNLEKYMKMHKMMFDVQQVMSFRKTVIDAIKRNCDAETTRHIIQDLREGKALESAIMGG
jgi:hypothetical protein